MYRAADLVNALTNFFVGVVEIFLGLRFIFRLLNANTANNFVSWVYSATEPLLAPFAGIFPTTEIEPGFVIEFTTLFAMLAYALLGFLISAIVDALTPTHTTETVHRR